MSSSQLCAGVASGCAELAYTRVHPPPSVTMSQYARNGLRPKLPVIQYTPLGVAGCSCSRPKHVTAAWHSLEPSPVQCWACVNSVPAHTTSSPDTICLDLVFRPPPHGQVDQEDHSDGSHTSLLPVAVPEMGGCMR